MRNKTLLISRSVPPGITGSAVIVGNLATQFTRDEMVIAGEKPFTAPAAAWRDDWPQISYIARGWPANWRGARWWRRLQFPLMLASSVRLVKKNRCAIIMAVFPNEEFLLIGYLTALITGRPFIPYFHNCYLENRSGLAKRFARWLQHRVFSAAKHVFVMSDGMAELYRERYPALKCSALVHTLKHDIPDFVAPPAPGSPLRLTICGNINESCRDAAVRVAGAVSKVRNVSLTLLTGTSPLYLRSLGLLRDGVYCASVPYDQVAAHLRTADVVVLPHGFTGHQAPEEYATIFPTRTLDYLICGRPILAHLPPDCFLARFLKERECALVVDHPSEVALLEAIERLRSDAALRAQLVRNSLQTAELYTGSKVADKLRTFLEWIRDNVD